MDELIAIAKRLDDAHIRFASETEERAKIRRNDAIKDAAAALRASAERERELRAVIQTYACDCQPGCCETGSPEDTICGARARAALKEEKP